MPGAHIQHILGTQNIRQDGVDGFLRVLGWMGRAGGVDQKIRRFRKLVQRLSDIMGKMPDASSNGKSAALPPIHCGWQQKYDIVWRDPFLRSVS